MKIVGVLGKIPDMSDVRIMLTYSLLGTSKERWASLSY